MTVAEQAAALDPADRTVLQLAFVCSIPCWSSSMTTKGWLDESGRLTPKGRELAEESLRQEGIEPCRQKQQ